ncbi:M23 family metallopeptidase [Candidatus Zixiibacteriota bacterium]
MAGKKKFNILIVPPSSGDTIQLNIPQFLISLTGFLLVCGVLLFGYFLLEHVNRQDAGEQLQALQVENAFLQSRLAGMRSSMATFGNYLSEIEQTEHNIRQVFDFPDVDPAERALGIGGFPVGTDSTINPYQQLSFNTEADLARLLRTASFERENFGLILDSLLTRRSQLDHTPSIRPCQGYFSGAFGMRQRHPVTGERSMHNGVDFAADVGTPVIAPADGKVVKVWYSRSLGKSLLIDHGYGIRTMYGHLREAKVKVGQEVKRRELIAVIGRTGLLTTGPHLHYEVHLSGQPINPMNYIYDLSTSFYANL